MNTLNRTRKEVIRKAFSEANYAGKSVFEHVDNALIDHERQALQALYLKFADRPDAIAALDEVAFLIGVKREERK